MTVLNHKLKDASFKSKYEANRAKFKRTGAEKNAKTSAIINDTIPVVVHIILNNPNLVTDAIVQSQIDVLNEDFQGKNADTTRIPAAFKPLFGKNNIVFMLAKTAPDGTLTNGIERRAKNISFNAWNSDNGKVTATGGLDAWNPDNYLNLWVVDFNDGTLGISVFPGDPSPYYLHGFMCHYQNFGRGAAYLDPAFNKGRTTTHEIGHFFNLFHIWGDDNGSCAYSDFDGTLSWDDTPNQSDENYGNPDPSGTGTMKTDACSGAPGIMYQNYMDYCDDIALVMFTKGQWKRMEQALTLSPDRLKVLNSTTYNVPPTYPLDAGISRIITPYDNLSLCSGGSVTPSIKLRNYGTSTLTSVNIRLQHNGSSPALALAWTGNIAPSDSVTVSLPAINLIPGTNTLKYSTTLPNGGTDQNTANDGSHQVTVSYTPPNVVATPIIEGFENVTFPSAHWSISNPDGSLTWERYDGAGKTGWASIRVNNYDYEDSEGELDYLKLPLLNLSSTSFSNASLSFYYAYRRYASNYNDTLEVVYSNDCGLNWTSLWKRGGSQLATVSTFQSSLFEPTSSQWSTAPINIDLTSLLNQDIVLAFRNKSDYGQPIYIDDVSLVTTSNPMPLTLLAFEGSQKNAYTNVLTWSTSNEINTAAFEIERSTDGTMFIPIGKVAAAGQSNETVHYSFADHNFTASSNYYRLKMMDNDGKFSFSEVINIKQASKQPALTVYPNPVETVMNVRFNTSKAGQVQLSISDVAGRVLSTSNHTALIGNNNFTINTTGLPRGVYVIKLVAEATITTRFVKK